MQKSNLKYRVFNMFIKLLGSSSTRKAHYFYKNLFNTDSRFEKELISKTLSYVDKGSTVLDIGANIGRWAIPISRKIGAKGHVHAFEPNKESFSFLKNRIRSFKNVSIHNIALSNGEHKEVEFLIQKGISCPANAAIAETASQITDKENFEIVKVESKSTDTFVNANHVNSVDFIKIDVEGHELEVIKGFKDGIKLYKPVLAIEILKDKWKNNNANNSDVAQLILNEGYRIGQFNESNKEYIFEESKFEENFQNFIFIPN